MPATGESRRRYFPGLVPVEAALWRTWLRAFEGEWDRFEYNVRVGEGAPLPADALTGDPELDANLARGWKESTQRRIDAVGFRGADVTLFEVKEIASASAVGQLMTYESLYPQSFPGAASIDLACVCSALPRDSVAIYEAQGIQVYVVDPGVLAGV